MFARSSTLIVNHNYLNEGYSLKSWLLTTDHKRIGLLYALTMTFYFLLGGLFTMLTRLALITPQADLFTAHEFNKLFTMHGIVMVFLFLIPGIPAILANLLLPLMIGARNVAFPRLNLASLYLYGSAALTLTLVILLGGIDTGWTFFVPYSLTFTDSYVTLAIFGICLAALSASLTSINVIATVHQQRAPGLTWSRLPLLVWSQYVTAVIVMLCTPVGVATFLLLAIERELHMGLFDPIRGGDPVLYQYLFWFYAQPVIYVMLLPAMGIISEIMACFSHKRIFGYRAMVYATFAIGFLSLFSWGTRLVVSGQSLFFTLLFALFALLMVVPFGVYLFSWVATLYKAHIRLETPMLYAFSFIGLMMVGGLSGLLLINPATSGYLHDTYFGVAHFHYMIVAPLMAAYMGALHFWWPKLTGQLYPEFWGKIAAITLFIGYNLTFFPMLVVGYMGMPQRYATYIYSPEFGLWHIMIALGLTILAVGLILPLIYLPYAFYFGPQAEANPWGATGLEWQAAASPPLKENFSHTPIVTEDCYAYL